MEAFARPTTFRGRAPILGQKIARLEKHPGVSQVQFDARLT
jgi:hypothetical protein